MSEPQHGTISGYVDDDCRWIYSVWDANQRDWQDVGGSRMDAEQYAARIPGPRSGG